MKEIVIRIIEPAYELASSAFDGKYVKAFDPVANDGQGKGLGRLYVTDNVLDAKRFPDVVKAWLFYRQQSPTVPRRPDGRENRPLTAFTVEMVPVEGRSDGEAGV